MFEFPISYSEPVFRPPSEARSLILQVTQGCSWNKCAFCEMYRTKTFLVRDEIEITNEIKTLARYFPDTRRIFLADGDAFCLPADQILRILSTLHEYFPKVRRISSYALPRNINKMKDSELAELRNAGLKLIYVGIESGDNEVLKRIRKGETADSTVTALKRTKSAGIKSSIIIINGLGGKVLSQKHAINTAAVLNRIQPEYFSTLVISFPLGDQRFRSIFGKDFVQLDQRALFLEMAIMLEHCELKNTVFRSDHASNYLVLRGNLNRDKTRLLKEIHQAIHRPDQADLRPEWTRGL